MNSAIGLPRRRLAGAFGAAAVAMSVASCTTTTPGTAVKAADDGGATVALMDTGSYAITSGRPFGAAGDDPSKQSLLEAHRLAEYTTGPWEVETALSLLPGAVDAGLVAPITRPEDLNHGTSEILPAPAAAVAAAHGVRTGFSTVRSTQANAPEPRGLQNLVLLFPTPADASAAATEMAAQAPPILSAPPSPPAPTPNNPDALALTYQLPQGIVRVDSYTAHGPYVLYQSARSQTLTLGSSAASLVDSALLSQKRRIDQFTPTAPEALAALPLDPTGSLLSRTLASPDGSVPVMAGVWSAPAWLHFELDPVATAALFTTAGVDAVSQRLTTVYQAGNPDSAGRLADALADQISHLAQVTTSDAVKGLPSARCYQRTKGGLPDTAPMTWQRLQWVSKCVGHVDRFTYTAFSADPADARRQMAAQYRILAGE